MPQGIGFIPILHHIIYKHVSMSNLLNWQEDKGYKWSLSFFRTKVYIWVYNTFLSPTVRIIVLIEF